MRRITGTLFPLLLLLTLTLSGCIAPAAAASPVSTLSTTAENPSYGIDPAAPHASAVLQMEAPDEIWRLHAFVPETGTDAPGMPPIELGHHSSFAISPDGRTLAFIRYANPNRPDGTLNLVDLQSWTQVETAIHVNDWAYRIFFSPDGGRLVISSYERVGHPPKYRLILADVAQQTATETLIDFTPARIAFTADGAHVMLYGPTDGPKLDGFGGVAHAARLAASDLTVEWSATLDGVQDGMVRPAGDTQGMGQRIQPATAFDPVRGRLYVVHADADKLTTVDYAAETVETVAIAPRQTWIERGIEQVLNWLATPAYAKTMDGTLKQAVLSKDGRRLFVIGSVTTTSQAQNGNLEIAATPLGLQMIDVETGTELAALGDAPAGQLRISPEGDRLFLLADASFSTTVPTRERYWTWVYDTDTLAQVSEIPDVSVWPARRLDGRLLLVGSGPLLNGANASVVLDETGTQTIFEVTDWSNVWRDWPLFD